MQFLLLQFQFLFFSSPFPFLVDSFRTLHTRARSYVKPPLLLIIMMIPNDVYFIYMRVPPNSTEDLPRYRELSSASPLPHRPRVG